MLFVQELLIFFAIICGRGFAFFVLFFFFSFLFLFLFLFYLFFSHFSFFIDTIKLRRVFLGQEEMDLGIKNYP